MSGEIDDSVLRRCWAGNKRLQYLPPPTGYVRYAYLRCRGDWYLQILERIFFQNLPQNHSNCGIDRKFPMIAHRLRRILL